MTDSLAHPANDALVKNKHEFVPNEGAQITSFVLWQCNSQLNTICL